MRSKMVAPDGHRLSRKTPASSMSSRAYASCQCRSEDARFYGEYADIHRQHDEHLKSLEIEKVPSQMRCLDCGARVFAYTRHCPDCGAQLQGER